nr:MAG TPA: Internal virion protein D [Caudoviricetes sp.]
MNPRRSAWGDFENTEHPYDSIIKDTAERYGLNHSLFRRQLYQESRFNPNAVSRAGAMGIGQIMPKTAKAYGVTDLSTLKDPFFNIDLAGRIMKDNLKYAKGNQYAALAMYNGGTAAMKNYLKGNYKELPKETWNYIDTIGDDDRWVEQKVDEAVPTVNPSEPPKIEKSLTPSEDSLIEREPVFTNLDLPEASKEIKPFIKDPIDEDAVRAALANTTRSRILGISFRSKRWADNRYVYDPSQDTSDEPQVGFTGGLKHGYVPTYLRMSFADGSIFGEQFAPTDEQRGEILGKVGYNMDRYYAVLNGATSMEDVEERLKINDEVIKYRQAEAKAGWFSSITSSIGSAVVDPLSYVPALGAYGMAGRVLTGAALGAVSNQIDTYVSGAEHDIMEDMLVGAMFGAGIEFAFKGLGKGGHYVGDTARRASIIREYQEAGKDLPSEVFDGIGGSTKVATSLNNLLDNIERRVPLVSTKGVFQALESTNFRKFCDSVFVDRGSGYVDENGVHYATRFQGQTVEEKLRAAQIDFENFESGYRESFNNLRKLGHADAEINLAICQAIENGVTPSKFVGNEEFSKIVESTKDFLQKTSKVGQRGGYVPRVSDPRKVGDLFDPNLPRGPQVERLVDELSHALVDGAVSNPEVRQRIIDYYKKNVYAKLKAEREAQIAEQAKKKDTNRQEKFEDNLEPLPDEPAWADVLEWMKKEAREDALGWIDQGTSMGRAIITDGNIANIKYDPEVTRIPWDTSVATRSGLSIDKLRRDPLEAVRMHHNKVIGDNILLSYGCENLGDFESMLGKMWSEEVNSTVGGRVDAKKFAQAQEQLINMIYNKHHSMSDVNSSWLGAMADVIRNLTFFSKNAMMGMANLFEQGEAIKHYGALHFFKGVPLVRELFDNWANNGMTNAEIRQAQSLIFGMSVRETGLLRDIATESFEKQLRRFNGDKAKSILVAATDTLAQASPFTKFLQNTENSIVEASQGMFLGELIQYAHNKSISKKGFLNKELMQRNGISQENFDNLLKILKESTTVGKNKEITIDNLDTILSKDPAALATLRRMGDYVAHEVIQKNTLGDTFLWEGAKKNPFMQLLLQFKTFALRSYDKRLKKILGRMAEGDALGQAYSIFLSTALGTVGALTNTLINTAGMNEEQRKEYLNKTLKYDPEEGLTLDTVMQVGINGAMRSSVFAFPSLLLNTAGVNTDVKTTTEGFSSQKERDELYGGFDADKWFRDIAPAYSTIKSFMDIVGYSANVARMTGDENYTDEQLENQKEKAVRAIRNSTNIPFLKWGVYNMLSDKDE